MNNPLVYVDQIGEFFWFVPIIVGAVVGAYLGGSAANNNFNPFKWDYGSWSTWRGMATGAVIGGISGASWSFGLAALNGSALVGGHTVVSGLSVSGLTKAAAWTVLGSKVISTATTVASMISDFDNAARIWAGKYYSDDNISFGGQLMQGLSRSTWEILQSWGGYNYSQIRNIAGDVDRVDYLGGATFVTNEGAVGDPWGVSIGNYLNLDITREITGSFTEWVTNNPLYMHEYGHTKDSRRYGPGYLFKIGIPSARSASRSTQISGEPQGVKTHDFQWYEMSANRYAAHYFRRYYGVDWGTAFREGTYGTYYPRGLRRTIRGIRTRR